jgi:hypothetical protein
MGHPNNPYFPGSDQYDQWERQNASRLYAEWEARQAQEAPAQAGPVVSPEAGVPEQYAGAPPQIAPAPAPAPAATPVATEYPSDEPAIHIVRQQMAVQEPKVPIGPSPLVRTPGSPGGLDKLGKKAEVEYPIQEQATEAAARMRASGVASKGYGEQQVADTMREGLAARERMLAQQDRAQRDYIAAVDRYRDRLEADAAAQAKEAIDPQRLFHGENGTWNRVVSIIGMGLGGFVQAKRGGENPFAAIMNRRLDEDLAAQKFEYESKAKSRSLNQQSFKLDIDKYGSIEAALAKRKADMWDGVAKEADMYRIGAGSEQIKTEAAAMVADSVAQASAYRMKAAEYIAKHTQAASGGGTSVNPAYLAEMERKYPGFQIAFSERVEKLKKGGIPTAQAQQAALAGDWMTDDMRKESLKQQGELASKQGKETKEGAAEIGKREVAANIPVKEQALIRLKEILATREPGEQDPPGIGMFKQYFPSIMLSEQGRINRQEVKRAINNYIHDTTGAAMGPAESVRLEEAFLGAIHNGAGLEQTLQAMQADVRATRAAIRGGFNPQTVQQYEQQRGTQMVPANPLIFGK